MDITALPNTRQESSAAAAIWSLMQLFAYEKAKELQNDPQNH